MSKAARRTIVIEGKQLNRLNECRNEEIVEVNHQLSTYLFNSWKNEWEIDWALSKMKIDAWLTKLFELLII